MNRYPRRRSGVASTAGAAFGAGCIAIILYLLVCLALLGAAVWVVATVVKAVFGL